MVSTKIKRYFILILAGVVFSMAGVLTLLTSPALAGAPVPDAVCRQRAQGLQDRANADAADANDINMFGNTCPNLCKTGEPLEEITGEAFLRVPGQSAQEGGVLTAVISTYPDGEMLFSASFFGPVAFFCNDGSVVVAAGQPSPADPSGQQQQCGNFVKLCDAPAP